MLGFPHAPQTRLMVSSHFCGSGGGGAGGGGGGGGGAHLLLQSLVVKVPVGLSLQLVPSQAYFGGGGGGAGSGGVGQALSPQNKAPSLLEIPPTQTPLAAQVRSQPAVERWPSGGVLQRQRIKHCRQRRSQNKCGGGPG